MAVIKNQDVFIAADHVLSPLGNTTAENFDRIKSGSSAVSIHHIPAISDVPVAASLFKKDAFAGNAHYTKFEQLLIASVKGALAHTDIDTGSQRTGLVISSTKGSISLIENEPYNEVLAKRISLNTSAALVAEYFGFVRKPVVVSNACISGVMAVITANRLIRSGQYDHMIVTGADVVSKFVVSGFQSFQALSPQQCKPFDNNRAGLNLGEGAATMILSSDQKYKGNIRVTGGGISNDANHISGPSRTGQELADAIHAALRVAGLTAADIDMISAHGTATPYNDEMEAKALNLAGVNNAPLSGLKAVYGHTLGAAGLIEGVMAAESMRRGLLLPTLGFQETGTLPLNVNTEVRQADIRNCIKTASGFGGCNGAMILSR